jgi:uncharacterized protein involved in exopolysaccharide biosynthesis
MEDIVIEEPLMAEREEIKGIRDFLTILFKHRTKILIIFFSIVTTVTIGTLLLSPVYEAKSTLLVKMGREYIYRPEVGDKSPTVSVNQAEMIDSEVTIITSRDLVEKVITALKVETIYPELAKSPPARMTPLEAAIIHFQKKLSAEGVKKSNMIEVTFQHKDPRIAARALNLLVDFYMVKHLQVYSSAESPFLDKQLNTYDRKLKESANNLESFKRNNGVFSLEEQRSLLLKQRSDLDTALKNSINTVEALQKRLVSLKELKQGVASDSTLYTTSERDKIIDESRSKLLSLELEEQELLKKYKEENRLVQHVRNEISMVKGFLTEQEKSINGKIGAGNVVYQETEKERVKTEADLSAERAKVVTLKGQVAQLASELQALDRQDKELQSLKRESAIVEKSYQAYAEKSEEARISDDMNRSKMSNVSVVQAATVPAEPVKSKRLRNVALGIVIGAVSGLGFAFFSEFTSQVFSTPESVERRLGLPVLATIARK